MEKSQYGITDKAMSLPVPYYEEPGIVIYHSDCRDILPHLPKVDLVFFDPPYGLEVAAWDNHFVGLDLLPQFRTLLAGDGVVCATCSPHILIDFLSVLKTPRIVSWGKPNLPMRKYLKDFEWSTEFILFERHGNCYFEKPHGENGRDYWRIPVENGFLNPDGGVHAARKPLHLLKRIVQSSCPVNGIVLDPFMGSGTSIHAAHSLGRKAIGIEIEEKYCEIAVRRLQQEVFKYD